MNEPTANPAGALWARLQRRKLVQWSIAYVAGAWVALQGLEFLAGVYEWPTAVLKVATLALALGLPIVVTLAWYHGERGEQRISGVELAIVTMLLLLGGAIVWFYQHDTTTAAGAASSTTASATLKPDASIAVLPFVNMSSDKEQEYFADGLSEELMNLLAQVPQLRVIARTSSFSFKGKAVDIATIARQLDVAHVLEGSVRRSGERFRITVQLIRASDSSHLWSQTYDRHINDVFQVQDEIAAAVVAQLKVRLLDDAPKSRPTDPRAYALYLQAREIGRQYTAAGFTQAIEQYRQALDIDASYVAAWTDLAVVHIEQVMNSLRPADEAIPLARAAIDRALAIDPDSARAYAARGWTSLIYERDVAAAARDVQRALALEPTNPDVLNVAAVVARRLGRLEVAISLGERQVARDPLNSDARGDLAVAYRYAGRLQDAIAEFRDVMRLRPGYVYGHFTIGGMLLQQGDAQAALEEFEQEPGERVRNVGRAMAYQALGRRADSDAALRELVQAHDKSGAFDIASIYALRGDKDAAFQWLERAAADRDPGLGAITLYAFFQPLHADPRWLPFLRQHGIAPEQLATIAFDVPQGSPPE